MLLSSLTFLDVSDDSFAVAGAITSERTDV